MGDRSSVNLRGEFHVENVTVFEDLPVKPEMGVGDNMDLDQGEENEEEEKDLSKDQETPAAERPKDSASQGNAYSKNIKFESQTNEPQDKGPDMDTLYPIFWSLQENFSTPTMLFDEAKLLTFKAGLESSMRKFKEVHQELQARGTSKLPEESKRGVKRKRNGQEDELTNSFNPKYLTSRDLFDLEVSTLAILLSGGRADIH